ncbi:MAG: glycosyltransferase family 39 protein [Deltaproteobacteria bacterium]|nr:glycosyltransferase family 39 protein [Deltaproteobacteria bacterium]
MKDKRMSQHRKRKKQIKEKESQSGILQRYWSEIIILITILAIAAIRYRLLGVPLERDEGEYAYMGQLLLQGILPYVEAYNMKFPGIYFLYALILTLFGQTHTGIHLALLVANVATIFLIYLLGKYLFDALTGTVAGISYGIISMSPWYHGLWANSEHYVVLFAIGGILLLTRIIMSSKLHSLFWSGILLGLSFTIKQHGILFALFGIGYFIITHLKEARVSLPHFSKKLGVLILGIITPFGLFLITLSVGGVLDRFWFWTFEYASKYVSDISLTKGLSNLQDNISPGLQVNLSIWFAAALGLTTPLWDEKSRSKWGFSLGFFLTSLTALCLGLYFRRHYFILLFPSLALLAGLAIAALSRKITSFLSQPMKVGTVLLIIIIICSYPLFAQRKSLFQLTPREVCRRIYNWNPFPESLVIARYLKQNTSLNDRIAVMGSEPQIYFYAHRRAATGYIYTYPLMKSHPFAMKMQKEMIEEIETNQPKYLVYVYAPISWLRHVKSNPLIFKWLKSYLIKHYERTAVIDIISDTETLYIRGEKVKRYKPQSSFSIAIFKRTN